MEAQHSAQAARLMAMVETSLLAGHPSVWIDLIPTRLTPEIRGEEKFAHLPGASVPVPARFFAALYRLTQTVIAPPTGGTSLLATGSALVVLPHICGSCKGQLDLETSWNMPRGGSAGLRENFRPPTPSAPAGLAEGRNTMAPKQAWLSQIAYGLKRMVRLCLSRLGVQYTRERRRYWSCAALVPPESLIASSARAAEIGPGVQPYPSLTTKSFPSLFNLHSCLAVARGFVAIGSALVNPHPSL